MSADYVKISYLRGDDASKFTHYTLLTDILIDITGDSACINILVGYATLWPNVYEWLNIRSVKHHMHFLLPEIDFFRCNKIHRRKYRGILPDLVYCPHHGHVIWLTDQIRKYCTLIKWRWISNHLRMIGMINCANLSKGVKLLPEISENHDVSNICWAS